MRRQALQKIATRQDQHELGQSELVRPPAFNGPYGAFESGGEEKLRLRSDLRTSYEELQGKGCEKTGEAGKGGPSILEQYNVGEILQSLQDQLVATQDWRLPSLDEYRETDSGPPHEWRTAAPRISPAVSRSHLYGSSSGLAGGPTASTSSFLKIGHKGKKNVILHRSLKREFTQVRDPSWGYNQSEQEIQQSTGNLAQLLAPSHMQTEYAPSSLSYEKKRELPPILGSGSSLGHAVSNSFIKFQDSESTQGGLDTLPRPRKLRKACKLSSSVEIDQSSRYLALYDI